MANIKSGLVVALAVVLVLNAMGSDEQKICGKSDGSGKTLWTGDCAGSQTFAVKEKKLVANFDFTGSETKDQIIKYDIGGCKFATGFTYSTATHTAMLDIDGNKNPRILPITAEITPDKVVFKREGRSNVTVSCSVNFDSVSGSFKISVKYEPTKPEQLKDLKTTYEAPIFVDSEKAAASSARIDIIEMAGLIVGAVFGLAFLICLVVLVFIFIVKPQMGKKTKEEKSVKFEEKGGGSIQKKSTSEKITPIALLPPDPVLATPVLPAIGDHELVTAREKSRDTTRDQSTSAQTPKRLVKEMTVTVNDLPMDSVEVTAKE